MAIGFGRLKFVQRSAGQNACAKSAYIGREKIDFHGTDFSPPKTYNWSRMEKIPYNEILLPNHVNKSFLNPEVLWNAAESKEKRINSQVALELVFALPDDLEVSLEDKIHLIKSYVQETFIDKGLAAQIAIHSPEKKIQFNPETEEQENFDHNWHSHVLVTTRRFKENGCELDDKKARDLMPVMKSDKLGNARVVLANDNGKTWGEHQNRYFESKGMSLRVDPNGVVSQIHLGPVRLRGRALSILDHNEDLKQFNIDEIKDPVKLIEHITKNKNVFSKEDLYKIINKFVGPDQAEELIKEVISQKNVVQLFDPETGKLPVDESGLPQEKYTTLEVLLEEKRSLQFADNIQKKNTLNVNVDHCVNQFSSALTSEQKIAFCNILKGKRLSCIEGHAGTGKSYLLVSLKNAYESEGYTVRAFGPDSATAQVLKDKGFSSADNVYNFLFSINRSEKNDKASYARASQLSRGRHSQSRFANGKQKKEKEDLKIHKGKEIWLIDEATKLSNGPMLQILKFADKYNAQVVFSGGASQLLPIERGCLYDVLSRRYGAEKLENIQRQKEQSQREISQKIAKGEMADAIQRLSASNSIIWIDSKERKNFQETQNYVDEVFGDQGDKLKLNDRQLAIEELVKKWASDREGFPASTSIIIACSNQEVRTINEMIRTYRKEKGEISKQEFKFETQFGEVFVSQGDVIEFGSKNINLGVTNGTQGTLVKISPDQLTILVKDKNGKGREVVVDPKKYASFKVGYATTYFRSQGNTLDRAYILHSVHTNKEMFYVALTRHVRKAYMFVPKSNFHYLSYMKAKASGYDESYGKFLSLNHYFKAKDTQEYLSDLIAQVSESTEKISTTDFVSAHQLAQIEKNLDFDKLKNSSYFLDKLKGHSLSFWNQVTTKLEGYRETKEQEKRELGFFSPVFKKLEEKVRIREEVLYEPSAQEYRQSFVRSLIQSNRQSDVLPSPVWKSLSSDNQKLISCYLEQAGHAWSLYKKIDQESLKNKESEICSTIYNNWQETCSERNLLACQIMKTIPKETVLEILGEKCFKLLQLQSSHRENQPVVNAKTIVIATNSIVEDKNKSEVIVPLSNHAMEFVQDDKLFLNYSHQSFSVNQKKLMQEYQQLSKESSSLYALVQAEKESNNEKSSHHLTWQIACGKRNAAAYQLLQGVSKKKLSDFYGQKSIEFLIDQAQRHEYLINRTQLRSFDLEEKLKENLEPLLSSLFPEGPTRKSRGEWRFGSKGSLVVTCHGKEVGSYYNFSEGKGGGPLQLIQTTLGLNAEQSKEWAMEFIGGAKNIIVPPQFKINRGSLKEESKWVSIKPNKDDLAPSLERMPNCKIARYCKEEARYSYKNEKGELLFYTVRLVNKKGEKSVLPLSYGFEKEKNEAPHWAFKAFQSNDRTLYNLQLLQEHPTSKVILVEGEKTADAANRLLNKHGMICLTWLGGAKATNRTDWSPLIGRDVIIWPDNDKPGFEAAKNVCTKLRMVGANSVSVVDEQTLVKTLPLKWDLADPLPKEVKNDFIRNSILFANEKSTNISNFLFVIDKSNRDIELPRIREILWRVEERLRPELEQTLKNNPLDIKKQIITETHTIYRQKDQLCQDLKKQMGIDSHQAERLSVQALLYKAEHGKEATQSELVRMNEVLKKTMAVLPIYHFDKHQSEAIYTLSTDRIFYYALNTKTGKFPVELGVIFEKEIFVTHRQAQLLHDAQQVTAQKSFSKGMDISL